jgi:3-oxoacyl-[acyl-carrier-protein] synthase-3
MLNIQKYGNTTAGTIPLCLWDYEKQMKKGDNIIISHLERALHGEAFI